MSFDKMESKLKPYAARSSMSRGRRHSEEKLFFSHDWEKDGFCKGNEFSRSVFQHDRDRIIHCAAFRRLEYKTQVFVNYEGDLFRTRLTHSLEVAQIARSIARNLGLNEDLSEAIALAHDLGHTPFGHAGQDALNFCMKDYGGFEHNLHGLHIVDDLEERYPKFNGLNLSFETREGILKHCSIKNALMLGELGLRFLNNTQPSLEAQVTNFSDEIAYNTHDIEDGLRSGLLTLEQLDEVKIWHNHYIEAKARFPDCHAKRLNYEVVRMMINFLIFDVSNTTNIKLNSMAITNIDEVRLAGPIVSYSDYVKEQVHELKAFLKRELYRHFKVMRMANKAQKIISRLFNAFMKDNCLLSKKYQSDDLVKQAIFISDYIAGMTDRYAIKEYKRLFLGDEFSW